MGAHSMPRTSLNRNLLRIVTHGGAICLYSLIIAIAFGRISMANAAKKNNLPIIPVADAPPLKPAPDTTPKPPGEKEIGCDVTAEKTGIDVGDLTNDITCRPERGVPAQIVTTITGSRDNMKSGKLNFSEAGAQKAIDALRKAKDKGWLGDWAIGELAKFGIPREGVNNAGETIDGVNLLTTRLVDAAYEKPAPKELALTGKARYEITKPRVCVAAYSDAHFNLKSYLDPNNTGTPEPLEARVTRGREQRSDADVLKDTKQCLIDSPNKSVSDCANVCASLGLRDQLTSGVLYTGTKLSAPPKVTAAEGDMTTGKIAPLSR
jgi:hypothetical protein